MRKTILQLVISMVCASTLFAGVVESRRITEEKRVILEATEAVPYPSGEPAADNSRSKFTDVDTIYFEELLSKRVTYISDASRVIAILMGIDKEYADPQSRAAYLISKKIFSKHMRENYDPDKALRKGEAAYMFCKALGIEGGLVMGLLGTTERYAMKELIHEGIMYPGDADDILIGKELVLMLTASAEYLAQRHGPAKK
jgi:hypothetical protein